MQCTITKPCVCTVLCNVEMYTYTHYESVTSFVRLCSVHCSEELFVCCFFCLVLKQKQKKKLKTKN